MTVLAQPENTELELSDVLHALSDTTRREILRSLVDGPRRCGSFTFPVSKSTVSHHFKVLRQSGLIRVEAQGNARTATLRREEIEMRFPGLLAVTGILDRNEPAPTDQVAQARQTSSSINLPSQPEQEQWRQQE